MGSKIINTAERYMDRSGSFVWEYFKGLGKGASWCVGFVLYVLIKAGCRKDIYDPDKTKDAFWVPTLEIWLHKHAEWVRYADAREGDIVIFTWHGGGGNTRTGSRDHVGFFKEHHNGSIFRSIEGNTSGGKVAERKRSMTNVYAIYRLKCCEEHSPEHTGAPKRPSYKNGSTYTVQVDCLNVRTGAGTKYKAKKKSQLTKDGQKHANASGQLMKGTRVTCEKTKTVGSEVWIRIPSGWICAWTGKKYYVK